MQHIYVTPLFAWTPWGFTTKLKHTPFDRFSTPVVQPMDRPHTHTQISPQALTGWYLRLSSLPELTKQLDAAAVVAAAAAVRVYVVASLGFDVNQRRSDGRMDDRRTGFFPPRLSKPIRALSLSLLSRKLRIRPNRITLASVCSLSTG